MNDPEIVAAMRPILAAFKKLGVSYYLGGSVASSIHGVARTTLDIDLVADIKMTQVRALGEILEPAYYLSETAIQEAIQRHNSFNLVHLASMLKVDIFVLQPDAYHQAAFRRRKTDLLADGSSLLECDVATPEDMILNKLLWFRMGGETSERQKADVLGVLKVQGGKLDFSYLRHWAAELKLIDLLEGFTREAGVS